MLFEMVINKSIPTDLQHPCVSIYSRAEKSGAGHWSASDDVFIPFSPKKHQPVLSNANQRKRRHIQSCTKIRTRRQLKGEFYSLLTSVVDTPEVKKVHRWRWGLMCKCGWDGFWGRGWNCIDMRFIGITTCCFYPALVSSCRLGCQSGFKGASLLNKWAAVAAAIFLEASRRGPMLKRPARLRRMLLDKQLEGYWRYP